MKLTSKLAVLFVLLAIVPLTLVSYLNYKDHRQTIEQDTINRLVSITILKEAEVNRWVAHTEECIHLLAGRPHIRENAAVLVSRRGPLTGSGRGPADPQYRAAHRSLREEHLNPLLMEESGFLELFILRGSDGLILASSDEKQEGKYRESEPYFVEGKKRTYVQNVYYSLSLGKVVMTISAPIKDKDGNLVAVLAGHVNLAEMSQIMLQRSGLSASEKTFLVNKFNFFITDPSSESGYALKKAVHTDGVKAGLKHQNGVGFYDDYLGIPVIGVYRWMPERELVILAEVDQAEAYAPIVALRKARLMMGAAVAVIVALLGLLFARTITGPLRQLLRGAKEVGRGNLEYRIELRAKDEIGLLAGAFNEMTADLRRSLGALRESEAKYRNLTESLDELVYRADPETFVTTYVNRAVEGIYGYTVEEWLRDPTLWESSIHPDDKERVFAWFTEAKRKMESGAIEYRIIRKDKTVRWVVDHAGWEKDQQGNVVSLNGVLYDITGRKQAEEELRESEEKYRNILENIEDGYFEVDLAGNFTFFNPSLCRILGYPGEEMPGMNNRTYMDAENAKKVFRAFNEVYVTGIPKKGFEWGVIRKDGTRTYIEVSVSLLAGPGEKPTGFRGIARDVAERRRAEERIGQLQEYLHLQIERMPIGLIVWDTEFRVTSWNPAAEKIFGFTTQEAMGEHPYGLIVPKEAQPHLDDIWGRLLQGDTTAHTINDNITKDGRTIICQWSNTPLIKEADGTVRAC